MAMNLRFVRLGLPIVLLSAAACGRAPVPAVEDVQPETPGATPVYNETTGRLEQILSDRDGDGRQETRAFMDGVRLLRIEIDRNGDDTPDRWEYYTSVGEPPLAVIERAEEADGSDGTITRRETYTNGVIERVEEDTTLDGALDKWETYQRGRLAYVDLDLAGDGRPTRRLVYAADGRLDRMESDPDGDGEFEPDQPSARQQ